LGEGAGNFTVTLKREPRCIDAAKGNPCAPAPSGVPRLEQAEGVVAIDPAVCQGCGNSASACPRMAIEVMHHRDRQFMAKIGLGRGRLEMFEIAASAAPK
jgi:Fe-S-cluster-containing dehydrogenase component